MIKVYAAFVTYRPDPERFGMAVKSVEQQVEKIIVADNTAHNEGIAKALNKAFLQAESEGCDYLITFDQDSVAPEGMVAKLLEDAQKFVKVGQIGPAYTGVIHSDDEIVDRPHLITSGALTSVQAWKDVGGFRDDYFIDNVDIEFSYRLLMKGYRVLMDSSLMLDHRLGDGLTGWMLNGKLRLGFVDHTPVRWYYMVRNTLVLRRDYAGIMPDDTRALIRKMKINVFRMLAVGRGRPARIKMVLKALKDYLNGKMGEIGN